MAGQPPKKNAAYIFYSSLIDTSNRPDFKDTPTLAAGDFKVSKDGGALANLATLPTNTPGGVMLKFSLSADEMNADDITVVCIDAAGAEWDDLLINIQTSEFQIGADLVDAIWDEALSSATHNVAQSSGKRLRQMSSNVIREETAQGAGTGTNQIQLDTGASAVDGAYDPAIVAIIGGAGIGQSRLILEYVGSTKIATVGRDWKVNPDATSEFQIIAYPGREHVNEGLAQGGTATTITLNALASSSDDAYIGQIVFIRAGTGADQARRIADYNGTTKVATINNRDWDTTPDTTSAYVMLPTAMLETVDANVIKWLGSAVSSLDASTVSSAVSSSTITQYRGDDWSISLTGLGAVTGQTEVWFSVKRRQSDTDAEAAVILSDGTGLEIINGTAGTTGNGTLTVDDASAGDFTMTLKAVESAKLAIGAYVFDMQWKNASGEITTIADGAFTVSPDVTLATT